MAGSLLTVHTAHTRVVRRRRADSRASTEPHAHRAETVPDTTTPYRRDFQPEVEMESAGRDSLPYCELLVTSEVETVKRPVTSETETVKRPVTSEIETVKRPVTSEIETVKRIATSEVETIKRTVTSEFETLERETIVFAKGSGEVPAITDPPGGTNMRARAEKSTRADKPARADTPARADKPARADTQGRTLAAQMSWLGIAQCQPEVGASLVIGTYAREDFCVTSPVTHVFTREDGVLVQTATKSRYFIEPSGDTYMLRKAP